MIELINVKKIYSQFTAVDIKKLVVPDNSIFGFLGKNGAGKTTTIKIISGMIRVNCGQVLVNSMDMSKDFAKIKRDIGFVADKPNVYEDLTGREFIKFMANLYGREDSKNLHFEINTWLKKLEIEEKADSLIRDYSHGTKQKVALIGQLIHKPKLLILDEPTVGLDPQSARALKDIIKDFRNLGGTVFLSTHALEVAEQLCDYISIIDKGQVLFSGPLNQIKGAFEKHISLEEAFIDITEKSQMGDN